VSFVIICFSLTLLLGGAGIILNRKGRETKQRTISVAIIARNEEKVLPLTLETLGKLDYPKESYELFLIDDCSTDRTAELFEDFAMGRTNVKVVKISEEEKELSGKKQGLQKALEMAHNEIFLLTDADCLMSRNWLKDTSAYWDEKTLMLVGYAPEDYSGLLREASFLHKLSFSLRRFIQLATAGSYAATIGLNIPFSCSGRNLGIAREPFLKAGGYYRTGKESSGDDKQALSLMTELPGKIRYSPIRNVVTHPELTNFSEQQKRRFGKLKMSSPFYFIATIFIIGFFIYLPFRVLWFADYNSFLIFYFSALIVWLINLAKHREKFVLSDLIFLIIYPYYMIYYTLLGLRGDWQWKS